jgi:hypothetical protein
LSVVGSKKRGKILCWIPSSILQEIFVQFGQKISAFDETVFFGFYIILMRTKVQCRSLCNSRRLSFDLFL